MQPSTLNHHITVLDERIQTVVSALSRSAVEIFRLLTHGQLLVADIADKVFLKELAQSDAALYLSAQQAEAILLNPNGTLGLAITPLDEPSDIHINVSIGTIFSILPCVGEPHHTPEATFLQAGKNQRVGGFFVYGPRLTLVLSTGDGVKIFMYCPRTQDFVLSHDSISIPKKTTEIAVNMSDYRHWYDGFKSYITDCLRGEGGALGKDYTMCQFGSLATHTYRLLIRGGVFCYPGNQRSGYARGHLRLIYQANPIAFVIEAAGGRATDTHERLLDIVPHALHQRIPLACGAATEVQEVSRYCHDEETSGADLPLFGKRGLFRANSNFGGGQ